jgi:hypothetical protein
MHLHLPCCLWQSPSSVADQAADSRPTIFHPQPDAHAHKSQGGMELRLPVAIMQTWQKTQNCNSALRSSLASRRRAAHRWRSSAWSTMAAGARVRARTGMPVRLQRTHGRPPIWSSLHLCQLFHDGFSRHWLSHSGVSTLAALCSSTAGHVMVLSKYGTAMWQRHWRLALIKFNAIQVLLPFGMFQYTNQGTTGRYGALLRCNLLLIPRLLRRLAPA